jgi:hypothetical protein
MDSGYIILTKKGNFYSWEIWKSKELAEIAITQLQNMGYDCIITTNEVELNFKYQ